MACAVLIVNGQTRDAVSYFDYSDYTFTYTEDGVTKTARLTDEATTPDHMIALLEKVYKDNTLPGTLYAYEYNGVKDNPLNYSSNANQGTPWTKGTVNATTYPQPDRDGMTLLLVQFNEGWTSTTPKSGWNDKTYITSAYKSIKLITSFTRVNDSENPGYLFSIDGATNRFFFISKGKARNTNTRPLYRLYEQISPVNTNAGSAATTSFINDMRAGNTYLCYHDCGDVGTVGAGHWFTISNAGEAYSLKNLTIFVPDRRFEDNRSTNTTNNSYYCYYGGMKYNHPEVMPKVMMYTAALTASAEPAIDENGEEISGYYRVNLDWSTSYTKEKLGVDVPQHYYVYVLNSDNTRTLIQDVVTDENGMVRVTHHDYLVQQTTDPQTINYVITGQPINYDTDMTTVKRDADGKPLVTISAESPVRSVLIPGYSPFFTQASEYRSRYQVEQEVNVYKNKMSIRPTTAKDFVAIKNNQEAYEVTRTDADGNKVTIADVQFSQAEGQEGYDFSVAYHDNTQVTQKGLLFDDEQPAVGGHITDFANSTVEVIDRFTASTATNDQSDKYVYRFEQKDNLEDNYKNYSNTLTVPVYKTSVTVSGLGYTREQIAADGDHSLNATPCNEITFAAFYDPSANLQQYDVYRVDDNKQVGKAENFNNSGQYHVYALNAQGQLNKKVAEQKIGTAGDAITISDDDASVADAVSRYVPVITTHYQGELDKENTYGCNIESMSYPQLSFEKVYLEKSKPYAGATFQLMSYRSVLKLMPILPGDVRNAYYYRVWRVLDDNKVLSGEEMLNTSKVIPGGTSLSGGQWDGSDYSAILNVYPGNGALTINDLFVEAYSMNKEVTYIARLYATDIDGEQGPALDEVSSNAPRRARASVNGRDYFIAEKRLVVDFAAESVVTGINDLERAGEVVSTRYYNLLGIPSSTPYPGVNIVVTTFSNGITTTEKMVR